jgi:hypothetical protein
VRRQPQALRQLARRDQHLVPTGDERNTLSTVFSGSDTSDAFGPPKGF